MLVARRLLPNITPCKISYRSDVKHNLRHLVLSDALKVSPSISRCLFRQWGFGGGEVGLDFFEAKIRPVLVDNCYECHSVEAANRGKLKGGLFLDTKKGIRKGGGYGSSGLFQGIFPKVSF